MTQTDVGEWRNNQAARIGVAIRALRGGRSAQWLSDATAELGERVTRAVITDIELGHRKYVAVHEISLIATALGVPPMYLMTHGVYPDGPVEFLPGRSAPAWAVGDWWGDHSLTYCGPPRESIRPGGQDRFPLEGEDTLPSPEPHTARLFAKSYQRQSLLRRIARQGAYPDPDPALAVMLREQVAAVEDEISSLGGAVDGRQPLAVTLGLGVGDSERPVQVNLAQIAEGGSGPHMVIAGGPGSGKTVLATKICRQLVELPAVEVIVSANKAVRKLYPGGVAFLEAPSSAAVSDRFVAALNELLDARSAQLRAADARDVAEYRDAGFLMADAFVVLDLDDSLDDESDLAVARVARTGGSLGVHLIMTLPDPANTAADPSAAPSVGDSTAWRLAGTVVRLGVVPGEGVCQRFGAAAPPPEKFRVLWQPGPG